MQLKPGVYEIFTHVDDAWKPYDEIVHENRWVKNLLP